MEAIKQAAKDSLFAVITITIFGIIILGIIAGLFFGQSIVTDQVFKVTSDTSRYSCIVSEVDNELLLNCLEIK